MDMRKNKFLWVFVIIGVIILSVLIISSFVIYLKVASISSKVESKLSEVNILLEELNNNLIGIDTLNQEISEMKIQLSTMNNEINSLPKNENFDKIVGDLSKINNNLDLLAQKYPPNQTVNIENVNQQDLNNAINQAVNLEFNKIKWQVTLNLILNIIFGSLLSIGGISIGIYFIVKKTKKQEEIEDEK